MPSFKSHLVAFVLKATRKKAFASPENLHAWIARARTRQDHRPPAAVARRLAVTEQRVAAMPVFRVRRRGGAAGGPAIVYLHGGAYCFEITPHHWRLIAELAERLDATLTVPIYPLAPEHSFEAIFAPMRALYRRLVEEEPADRLILMGDSAGGNMALVLTMMAAEAGLPAPGRQVLISPGLDMSLANPAIRRMADRDPWLDIPGGLEAVALYAPALARTDWRVSPLYGDLSVLPRTLVLSGTRDVLSPDTVLFAERAAAAGVDVELVLEPDMIHVWPLIDMPEARHARDRIVAFCRAR
ncbi:alpha/beta hydrolase [Aquibium sp. A9E412]|uniref:alpha/beta hydrolase n=1 Tax=Aquibium sp. A9E412 TaxID=2976767 RepID=UPI0025AEE131|nr:alpha/beta hydrolase [Aquibium sp. A9E412]MDN2568525.1 alpha/beta hydrolase [Aquibium sp. A9E412]